MKPAVQQEGTGRALVAAVLLHLAIVAVVILSVYKFRPAPQPQRMAIEAIVVFDQGAAARPVRRQTPVVRPPEPEPVPPEPEPPEPEPKPPAPDTRAQDAALEKQATERRAAEQRRLAAEREDAQRREALAREKAAQDKAERDKAEKEKAEREKAVERARAQREAELGSQIQAEERLAAARASGAMNQYIAQITARIERAWIRPATARTGIDCEVKVTQLAGGAVTAVQVTRCNGDDAVRQSIEAAVYRASPLPLPADPSLFERSLVVTFRPED